jgi:hypothetical protein
LGSFGNFTFLARLPGVEMFQWVDVAQLWRGGGGQFGRGGGLAGCAACYFGFHSLKSGSLVFFCLFSHLSPWGGERARAWRLEGVSDLEADIARFSDSDFGERFINDLRMTWGYCGDNRGSGLWFDSKGVRG